MAHFLIAGSLVDTDAERETLEDVTPTQLRSFIAGLEPGEPLTLDITSYGGSVTAGLAMLGLLRQASADGHRTAAHIIGIAASMASALGCGCEDLTIDSNAFVMVHLPWTSTTGNAVDLRKEADTLDLYRDSLVAVYRTKFDLPDSVIVKMLEDETWFLGSQAHDYKLDAEIIPVAEPFRVAASLKGKHITFAHTPKAIQDLIMTDEKKNEEPITAPETIVVEKETVMETTEIKTETETITKTPVEEKPEEETPPEDPTPEPVEEPVEETITKAEADKRVQGMQSVMAKKLDALRKEYDAKVKDFESQLKTRSEELTKANARITSLESELASKSKEAEELSERTSALAEKLEEKNKALTTLCGATLTPPEGNSIDWRKLKGKAFFDYLKSNGMY